MSNHKLCFVQQPITSRHSSPNSQSHHVSHRTAANHISLCIVQQPITSRYALSNRDIDIATGHAADVLPGAASSSISASNDAANSTLADQYDQSESKVVTNEPIAAVVATAHPLCETQDISPGVGKVHPRIRNSRKFSWSRMISPEVKMAWDESEQKIAGMLKARIAEVKKLATPPGMYDHSSSNKNHTCNCIPKPLRTPRPGTHDQSYISQPITNLEDTSQPIKKLEDRHLSTNHKS